MAGPQARSDRSRTTWRTSRSPASTCRDQNLDAVNPDGQPWIAECSKRLIEYIHAGGVRGKAPPIAATHPAAIRSMFVKTIRNAVEQASTRTAGIVHWSVVRGALPSTRSAPTCGSSTVNRTGQCSHRKPAPWPRPCRPASSACSPTPVTDSSSSTGATFWATLRSRMAMLGGRERHHSQRR